MINCTTPNNEANISSLNMLYNVTNTDVIGMGGDIMFNYNYVAMASNFPATC